MGSYECPNCRGNGTITITVVRGDEVEREEETCRDCKGTGIMRNGESSIF